MSGRGKPHSFQIKQGTQPKEVHPMMNRNQAIAYGKHIGVRWHIYNSNGCLVGGTKTLEQAQAMKRRFMACACSRVLVPPTTQPLLL